MGQGVRGPGPSEESEKRSQEDARLLRPVADTRGQGGAAGMAPEEGAAQTQPGGRTKSGRGGRLLAPACGVGPWGHRSGRGEPRAPAAPRRGREGGHSPAWGARRLLPAARAPAQAAARPLCAWRVTRGRSRRRARERPPAPRAPFQAQQRPRRGPALTHFPSRLLDPKLRIQRPPPSRFCSLENLIPKQICFFIYPLYHRVSVRTEIHQCSGLLVAFFLVFKGLKTLALRRLQSAWPRVRRCKCLFGLTLKYLGAAEIIAGSPVSSSTSRPSHMQTLCCSRQAPSRDT
ncbi:uncharacterized protein [Chlorocebus sabaeus]|uniref:uncharacterized protein n=1 Tax=Chlorocebus sabaeus TaxID=60711 RepID=UPI00045D6055